MKATVAVVTVATLLLATLAPRPAAPSHTAVAGPLPAAHEGELVLAPPTGSGAMAAPVRKALPILAREQRTGVLRGVLGASPPRIVQAGELRAAGRPIGVTVLLSLAAPRRGVRATVPGYVASGTGYRPETVRFTAAVLRDVLVDIDLRSGRVIAVQPGPQSQTTRWTPSLGTGPSVPGDAPAASPPLVRLSDRGPAFLAYDGAASLGGRASDWPVSLIFTGHATIAKVKRALRSVGLTRVGHRRYLAYSTGAATGRFDGDRGLKTRCDANGTDVHVRLYAPPGRDRFTDPEFGSVVVATVHLDRADGCSTGPVLFGFSEAAERQVASTLATRLGWHVQPNLIALGNAEPYRRDVVDSGHVWWSDGRATVVNVP